MSYKTANEVSKDNLVEIKKSDGKYCYSFIRARHVLIFLGFWGYFLLYSYKVVLSVTIVAMVSHSENASDYGEECIDNSENVTISSPKYGEFDWDSDQKALILGGFFYGYVITQIPGGFLSERYGSKWIFGTCILGTAVLSLLSPVTARIHFIAFFVTRFIQGLFIGFILPCMNAMCARWIPIMERSLMSTILFTGSHLGTVVTLAFAGYLSDTDFLGGWPAPYYILGIAGCVWFVLWAFLTHEMPDTHPHISQKEFKYIKMGQGDEEAIQKPKVPWKKICTSVPFLALIIAHFGQNWGFTMILTELPTYFEKILHLDIKSNGLMSSLPYLLEAIIALIVGYFADKLRERGTVHVTVIRKVCTTIGFMVPAVCMIGVTLAKCNSTLTIILFTIAMGLNGFTYSGFNCTHLDLAPDFAGTLFGITNSISNMCGIITPLLVSALTKNENTIGQWAIAFYIAAAVYTACGLFFIIFGSAKLQSWGVTKKGLK